MNALNTLFRSKLDIAIIASVAAMAAMNVVVLASQMQPALLVSGPVLA